MEGDKVMEFIKEEKMQENAVISAVKDRLSIEDICFDLRMVPGDLEVQEEKARK